MTIDEINQRLEKISEMAGDPEVAHTEEGNLMRDFIQYVAASEDLDLSKKASLVLTAGDISFPRWCA